jgi:predicted cupin superfamily sugar epimerase
MKKTMIAKDWILNLDLLKHPEGGYFKETYRSDQDFEPLEFNGKRNYATSIYFLITTNEVSHFHEIKSDEIWYFHAGSALKVHCIQQDGTYFLLEVGPELNKNQNLQVVVPKGTIFASESSGAYSLVGCMVSPGFDFKDFKLFTSNELLQRFPQHETIIKKFTKENYKK